LFVILELMVKRVKKIYLDYAATTPVDQRVLNIMLPYFTEKFGNSTSLHSFGQEAKIALEESRQIIAQLLNAQTKEIIFTASATESNNFALKGVAFANKKKGRHIIVSSIEHKSVLNSAKWLATQGFKITYLPVDKYGLVSPKDIEKAIKKKTILVSIMHANNEIGTVEPIKEIGKICRNKGVYFHTDAAQSFGKIPIDVKKMYIDLLTASSHKIYGPKGVALLYIREGVKITPLLHGGGHEFGYRSSTINIPAVLGFAKAAQICQKEMRTESQRLSNLRNKLIKEILKRIPGTRLNGHPTKRLPNNVNIRFPFVEGESIVMQLDNLGIIASSASACSSLKLKPSHVLLACGLKTREALTSLRLSLGRWTTQKDIDYLIRVLPGIIKNLRKVSLSK